MQGTTIYKGGIKGGDYQPPLPSFHPLFVLLKKEGGGWGRAGKVCNQRVNSDSATRKQMWLPTSADELIQLWHCSPLNGPRRRTTLASPQSSSSRWNCFAWFHPNTGSKCPGWKTTKTYLLHYTEGYLIYRYTTQKDSSSGVSLHRRKAHLGFHYTEGKLICSFTTQKDSSSRVSLHRRKAHLGFHYTEG